MPGTLDEIDLQDCLELLRFGSLGRISVDIDGGPVIVPVNYRLVETSSRTWVEFRTRPGNSLDRYGVPAAFEIDHVDHNAPRAGRCWYVGCSCGFDPEAGEICSCRLTRTPG